MKRHAYLILAHSQPEQLKTLLRMLDDKRNDIFVHVDARAAAFPQFEEFAPCCRESHLQFIEPRVKVHWGGVSIMRAELALLEKAVQGDYSYLHLLSGMDLPIKSQDHIHAFFEQNEGKEFLDIWPMEGHTIHRVDRYTIFPEGAGNFGQNLLNIIVKGIQGLLGIRINKDVDFHMGSQWFSITMDCAKYVVSKKDWLEKVFRHTNTIDEIFLPTVLFGTPFWANIYEPNPHDKKQGCNMSNLRLIDWTRGESSRHPWTFRTGDEEFLLSSPQFWARKFDSCVDSQIITFLENTL